MLLAIVHSKPNRPAGLDVRDRALPFARAKADGGREHLEESGSRRSSTRIPRGTKDEEVVRLKKPRCIAGCMPVACNCATDGMHSENPFD